QQQLPVFQYLLPVWTSQPLPINDADTAGPSCNDNPSPSRYTVGLGSHVKNSRDSTQKNYAVDRIVMHSRYNYRTLDYDYALLRLSSSVSYNNYITPACIPSSEPSGGQYCYTTGWGDTRGTGSANALKQAYVPVIARSTCNSVNYPRQITSRMTCAGYPNGGVDACQGDSGGPFVCSSGSGSSAVWYVHGVTSWGYDCARPGKPGVYATVATVRSWINGIIN
uniref:Peptidase S1 domain-containing protein n=1 Tax=Macrostomum lignano TaxID=282301 RepID=A0A1I8IC92_9PLAT